ncbi:MobF family relaxase [Kitasatospora sp. NPDC059648]|uniref:MobF family relaxase n=1 Tax=Kitasatospora sp. NPDC059648 TaxID=3346894 RepID=UPI0036A6CD2C
MTATVSFGSSPDYLLGSVGGSRENYYMQAIEQDGEPPGVWVGAGAEMLGLSGEVDPELFKEMYTHFTDPRRFEELQSVTAERWAAYRKAHPDLQRGTDEYRAAKAAIRAEVRSELRLGSAPRDYSKSTETKVKEALAALPEGATPEQMRAAEMGVRRNAQSTKTYVDVTFSAPKSWSLLHAGLQVAAANARAAGNAEQAAAYEAQAEQVWEALKEGAAAGLAHMQEHAGYSREGRFAGAKKGQKNSTTTGRRVDAHEWTAASFAQHLSRDEDPQLHIHTAVWNRVAYQSVDPVTGETITKWGALDGKLVLREAKAAGHIFEKVAEEALVRRLGVRFEMRPDGVAREVVGISQELRDQYSSRRRTVEAGVKELAEAYEAKHGVRPSAHTLAKMSQFVVLKERKQKSHDGTTREELLARWEAAAVAEVRESLAGVPEAVAQAAAERGTEPEPFDPAQVVREAIEAVQSERSAWTRAHLQVQIIKHLPDCLGGLDSDQVTALVTELTDVALTNPSEAGLVSLAAPELIPMPRSLQMADGTPIYQVPGAEQYATKGHIEREERLLADATLPGGPALTPEQIERALAGRTFTQGQEAAVRGILGGGRQADVLIGPAGAGKSYVSGAIHDAWTATGRSVLGLTTSERAARVLAGEGVEQVGNLQMFVNANKALAEGRSTPELEKFRLRPGQLVIVDEVGMSETHMLDQVRQLAREAGAKILYAGDHAQLTAVGAGGMLAELAQHSGVQVYQLDEVLRFSAEWEREASLQLREGDVDVLAAYEDRGRLFGGGRDAMVQAAYQDWLADTLAGQDSILIAASQAQADQLAAMARADLVRLGRVEAEGVQLALRGITIGCGDQIQLREVNREVRSHSGDRFAVNRDVVTVVARDVETGELTVAYDDGELMTLPPSYVQQHVDLAYAGTVHAAQGRTVDRCRVLVEGGDTRESIYVALTRGKHGNWAYVVEEQQVSELDGDPVSTEKLAVLAQALETTSSEQAALGVIRQNLEDSVSLVRWSFILDDLQDQHAQERYGRIIHDTLGAAVYRDVRDDAAFGPLVRLARAVEAAGHDPEELLRKALVGDLSDARHTARVLHDRLEKQLEAADRAKVRADERDVREHVEAQEQAVPAVVGAASLAPVVAERPELVMTYDAAAGTWVQRDDADPDAQALGAPVVRWDYEAGRWAQQTPEAEHDDWVIAPPAPRGLDEAVQAPAYGQEPAAAQVWDATHGWVEVTVDTAVHDAVEAAWLQQLQETNLAVAVLHAGQEEQRRSELADQRRAEAEERARWQTRVAELPGEKGDVARAAAELMDERRLLLGRELAEAEELPQWAQSLGPVPGEEQAERRQQWIERAGTVAAYREAHDWDSEVAAIGPRPARGAVDYRADWDRAFMALGEPEERMELVGATDAQLRELVEAYQREEAWAPVHVAPELKAAHVLAQELAREQAQREIQMLETSDEAELQELQRRSQEAAERAADAAERAIKLEEIHGVREAWHAHTEEARARAQAAAEQLELRRADVEVDPEWDMAEPAPEEFEHAIPDAEWDMSEPEPEGAEIEDWPAEFLPLPPELHEPALPEPVAVAEPQPAPEAVQVPQQSEAMRRHIEEMVLAQAEAEQLPVLPEQAPAPVVEAAPAVEAPAEPVAPVHAEQFQAVRAAVAEPAAVETTLAGPGLDSALAHARAARGILDERQTIQDRAVAEARAAIEALQASRQAPQVEASVPAPSAPAAAPQIQIQQ